MPKYLVKYSIGKNNEYVYPKRVEAVIWKSAMFHFTRHEMIGETDSAVHPDGKNVILLDPTKADKLEKKYLSVRPPPKSRKSVLASKRREI